MPLVFGRAHADMTLSENGAVATRSDTDGIRRTAASKMVMRSGRHCVQFTVVEGDWMYFGVVRRGWDVEGGAGAERDRSNCLFHTTPDATHATSRAWTE